MKRRGGLVQALLNEPEFLIVDVNWGNLFECVSSV